MVARRFLPYGRQWIDEEDISAVVEVLRSNCLTTGPAVDAFEERLAGTVGARHVVACSSGTAGLHLAAVAADLGPGDVAIVPAVTFLATANCVRLAGAEVAFADVDPDTGLMGPAHLRAALERAGKMGKAKLAVPVHLAGQAADMPALAEVAEGAGVTLIEDACHALGTVHDGAAIGSCDHSAMAVFSFHPVKTVAMGEGGAVATNDPALAARLARLRNHGMVREPAAFQQPDLALGADGRPQPWYYEMHEIGFNYRASDIHCALGLSQLGKLARFVARRRHLVGLYDRSLGRLAPLVRPLARAADCQPAWHLYVVLIDFDAAGVSRADVMRRLRSEGIGTQVHYIPVNRQPAYRRRYGDIVLPGAESYYRRCLSLPLFPGMEDNEVPRVVEALERALTAGGGA